MDGKAEFQHFDKVAFLLLVSLDEKFIKLSAKFYHRDYNS